MVKTKKILVIVDTNRLGNYQKGSLECRNYNYLEINKHLHENLVNNFNFKFNEHVKIEVAIPKIVLEELKQQQNECFIRDFKRVHELFTKFSNIENMELTFPEINYRSHLESKGDGYLGKYEITEIETPSDKVFNKLIEKVMKKEKPFYKKNGEIDSGFKDAIIWESILEFVKEKDYDRYFFLTNDRDFEDDSLNQEFSQVTGNGIKIVKEIADLKGLLEEEIEGTKTINSALEEIEKTLYGKIRDIISGHYIETVPDLCDVEGVVDYKILDLEIIDGEYILSILAYIEHESEEARFARHSGSVYLGNSEISPIEINLILDKDYNIKKFSSEDIMINREFEVQF